MLPWQPKTTSEGKICYHGNQIQPQQVKYVAKSTKYILCRCNKLPGQPNTTSAGKICYHGNQKQPPKVRYVTMATKYTLHR